MNYPKKQAFDYLLSLPFLISFAIIMLGSDLLQRLFSIFNRGILDFFGFLVCQLTLLALRFTGLKVQWPENFDFDKNENFLIISNHQSLMDIAIIWKLFKNHHPSFITKKELTRFLPFVSFNLRHNQHIIIDRGNAAQAIETLKNRSVELINKGRSIIIFPEGTRARDGKLKKFKQSGILAMADSLNKNNLKPKVLPLCINGAWKISSFKLMPVPRNIRVKVSIGDSFILPDSKEELEAKIDDIESWISSKLNE